MAQSAYYRMEVKIVSRGKGHSSVAAAAYIAAERLRDERTGTLYNYRRKQHVYSSEILAPANAPEWAQDRSTFWNTYERMEKRKDAQLARQFVLSFPTCLSHAEKQAAARAFVQKECVAKGMIADIGYHDFEGKHKRNPHAHVMVTIRAWEGDRFGKKNRDWLKRKDFLHDLREKWAHHLNQHLERGGYQERVDHRNYEDRGIDRIPLRHEGRAVTGIREAIKEGKRTTTTWLIDHNDERRQLQLDLEAEYHSLAVEKTAEQDNQPPKQPTLERMAQTASLAAQVDVSEPKPPVNPHQVTSEVMKLHYAQGDAPRDVPIVREVQQSADVETAAPTRPERPADSHPIVEPPTSKPTQDARKKPSNPHEPTDRTWQAIRRQLEAMGGDGNFELGILDRSAEKNPMTERTWHRDQILRYDPETKKSPLIQFLKRENTAGRDIYIRPARLSDGRSQGLVLVDDIDLVTVEDMRAMGVQPALVVETSHKNCQAWVKIAPSLSREEATQVAKLLAKEVGGDLGSASYQHYGRLAGFTNRKEEHLNDKTGKYPWVMVQQATHEVASNAEHYLALARQELVRLQREQAQAKQYRVQLSQEKATADELDKAVAVFLRLRAEGERKHHLKDSSSLDWVAAKLMAKRGWKVEALEHALWHSPDLESRKKGHPQDYVTLTVNKLAADPDVLTALHRREERRQVQERKKTGRQPQPGQDARETIWQWQQFHDDQERGSRASSTRTEREQTRPGGERKKAFPFSLGQGNSSIRLDDIPVHTLGEMDAETVAWLIAQTHNHPQAQRQFAKADWLVDIDTAHWRDQCKAEYYKELGRCIRIRRALARTPHTDAEIAVKLRMAGFSSKVIARTLRQHSPFVQHLNAEQRDRYLAKGIAPIVNHRQTWRQVQQFQQMRMTEAQQLPEQQREAYLKEHRLEQLKLSTTKERWEEQQGQHPRATRQQEPERER